MGGFGSGNRTIRLTAMATVEESLKLTPGMLPQSVWFGAEATFLFVMRSVLRFASWFSQKIELR